MQEFGPAEVPVEPTELFGRWLREAVSGGVREPHAMTLSTCDSAGEPDARVLILKDLDEQGWWFATNAKSVKGSQLTDCPAAALTFYWPQVARQVRVRGPVITGEPDVCASDFLSRGIGARAVALASAESTPLDSRASCQRAVADARQRLNENPDWVSPTWRVYAVAAHVVEFWQADTDRMHVRVQYRRRADGWHHTLLWP
ncbi:MULTISPECIES: pyridoxal 5'-phosphate synthase [unclassified Mycolicibacterium]|uniref:pyridoxine/pyridoxamine 5'-phosphate oxidase n=1 Tax=unclassified Mycolicibacterium TaxID=2636767 RepID=UPI0028162403|nr:MULTISPECIES: pyridoxal 5'-phosphate synthase [unclassified Mycolicibacterium]